MGDAQISCKMPRWCLKLSVWDNLLLVGSQPEKIVLCALFSFFVELYNNASPPKKTWTSLDINLHDNGGSWQESWYLEHPIAIYMSQSLHLRVNVDPWPKPTCNHAGRVVSCIFQSNLHVYIMQISPPAKWPKAIPSTLHSYGIITRLQIGILAELSWHN